MTNPLLKAIEELKKEEDLKKKKKKPVFDIKKEKSFFGLKTYYIYEYNSSKSPQPSLFSKIINGKKASYLKNGKKVIKSYKGIADGKKIIKIGNALIVEKKEDPYIQMLFNRFKIDATFKKMVFML